MKTLHYSIIVILILSTSLYLKPIQADDANGVKIENIQTLPSSIIIGETFKINATLVNNSSKPIFVDYGSCEAPFSVTFDNHVLVNETHPICKLDILEQKLNPGEKTMATSPNLDLVYRAAENGTVNATIAFPYKIWNQTIQSNSNEIVSEPFSFVIYGKTRAPTLSPPENQAIIDVALAIPGLQKWSNDWQYDSIAFMTAKNQPGNWQYAIVYLKASSSSSIIPCDSNNDWSAMVMIDRTTMKVIQATYPTMESHNCNYTTGGGPGTSGGIVQKIDTPLKQFKSGIAANDVKCEQGLQLMIKSKDNSPACVKPQTAQKLVERGWGWAMQPIDSLKPLLPNRIAGLENDTGVVIFGNRTYYFETPHYTQDAYVNPVHISFHGVVFTLFPPGFKGGLPTDFGGVAANGCSGSYFWTDAKFPDGTHTLLSIFAVTTVSQQCLSLPSTNYFSTHTDPLAGLTFYEGKLKLLVSVEGILKQNNSVFSTQIPTNETIYHDFPQPRGYSIIDSTQGIIVNNDAEASNLTGFSVKSPTDLPQGYKVKLIKASKEIPMVTIFVSKYPLTNNATSEDFLWNQQGILITYQQTSPHELENFKYMADAANKTITIAGTPAEVFDISKEYNNGYPYDMWATLIAIKDNNTNIGIRGFFNSDDLIKIATSMLEK